MKKIIFLLILSLKLNAQFKFNSNDTIIWTKVQKLNYIAVYINGEIEIKGDTVKAIKSLIKHNNYVDSLNNSLINKYEDLWNAARELINDMPDYYKENSCKWNKLMKECKKKWNNLHNFKKENIL